MERRSRPAPPLGCHRAGRPGYGRLGRGQDGARPAPSGSAIPGRVEEASDGARVRTCGPGRGRRRSAGMPGPPLPARTAEGAAPGRVAGPGSGVPGRAPRGRHGAGSVARRPTCRSVADAPPPPGAPDRARRDVRPTRPRPPRPSARCGGAAVRRCGGAARVRGVTWMPGRSAATSGRCGGVGPARAERRGPLRIDGSAGAGRRPELSDARCGARVPTHWSTHAGPDSLHGDLRAS